MLDESEKIDHSEAGWERRGIVGVIDLNFCGQDEEESVRPISESLSVVQPIGLVNEITGKLIEAITLLLRVCRERREEVRTDCEKLQVVVRTLSGGELTIKGDGRMRLPKMCTLAKARKHVLLGGSSYLAYVVDSRAETRRRREFPDEFPDDLPDISHERQVEFQIELIPGVVSLRPVPGSTSGDAGNVADVYLLPRVNQAYDTRCRGSTISSINFREPVVLEDRSSLRVRGEDVHKTAFCTRYVYFEFIVMSFGLTNAPAAFVDPMNQNCRPMLDRSVIIEGEASGVHTRRIGDFTQGTVVGGEEETAAIETLRRELCEAPVLTSPGTVEDMAVCGGMIISVLETESSYVCRCVHVVKSVVNRGKRHGEAVTE
ncbi:LOW QUALITY PROTEIN: hypothetical protein OSB04_027625, partial [Centaurea solstitialis]